MQFFNRLTRPRFYRAERNVQRDGDFGLRIAFKISHLQYLALFDRQPREGLTHVMGAFRKRGLIQRRRRIVCNEPIKIKARLLLPANLKLFNRVLKNPYFLKKLFFEKFFFKKLMLLVRLTRVERALGARVVGSFLPRTHLGVSVNTDSTPDSVFEPSCKWRP